MNKTILEFLYRVMDSNLPKDTINEIVRWYTLPRNTEIRSLIEIEDEELQAHAPNVGVVKRPDSNELYLKDNPHIADEMEENRKVFAKHAPKEEK